jgi:hypothetical protein
MSKDDLDVIQVTVRRKINLGNFENEDIEFVANVREGQDFREVAKALDKETRLFKKYRES